MTDQVSDSRTAKEISFLEAASRIEKGLKPGEFITIAYDQSIDKGCILIGRRNDRDISTNLWSERD